MPLVDLSHLTIAFNGRPAVADLSLQLDKGDRFGLIGESGSGKSLTALAIAGLLPDTATATGDIVFDGAPLPRPDRDMARLRARHFGMVFQEPMTALNPLMRIGDQIVEAVKLAAGAAEKVADLLLEVGLEPHHADRYPHQLSGGQRQRAMIAMALAGDPELLIADEPTSALDVITQRKVLDLIDRVATRRQMTLLFISHDVRAVAALCTRVGVMQSGRLVEQGEIRVVLGSPRDPCTQRLLAATRVKPNQVERSTGEVLLRADAVTRDYGQSRWWRRTPALRAVDAVSFSVAKGECVALVGPSGCGKTTLARMVVGLDRTSAGQFMLGGTVYHGNDLPPLRRADISLVFQDPFASFDPRMRIGQSLGEPLRLIGHLSDAERMERLGEAVEAVGLSRDMLERYPHAFSGGQRQRLAIARALVTRPKLIVLDEPVSALDVSVRGDVLRLLTRLQAEHGLSYLIISHDLDMVAAMADRVLVMEAGRIIEEGTPAALFANPQQPLTRALMAARLPDVSAYS